MEHVLEEQLKKYNQIKIDLLKVAQCIDCCDPSEISDLQDICIDYSHELKDLRHQIESIYGIKLCNCCEFSPERKEH